MTTDIYKAQAKRLGTYLNTQHNIKLKHSQLLESIAAIHSVDWNTLVAKVDADKVATKPSFSQCDPSVFITERQKAQFKLRQELVKPRSYQDEGLIKQLKSTIEVRPPMVAPSLNALGLPLLGSWLNALKSRSTGLHVVCGPIGSGKSTLIYSAAQALCYEGRHKVCLVTDTLERSLMGGQVVLMPAYDHEAGSPSLEQDSQFFNSISEHRPAFIFLDSDRTIVRSSETLRFISKLIDLGAVVVTSMHAGNTEGAMRRLQDMDDHNPESMFNQVRSYLYVSLEQTDPGDQGQQAQVEQKLRNGLAPKILKAALQIDSTLIFTDS